MATKYETVADIIAERDRLAAACAKYEADDVRYMKELAALRKDADRYRWLRDAPRADVRVVGRGARKGDALDATVDELRGAA